MSTRSGKRIHSSFQEDTTKVESEVLIRSERKTRHKRFKENDETLDVALVKPKKRRNYVSYPDEPVNEPAIEAPELRSTRKIKRYTLKQVNTNVSETAESLNSNSEAKKTARVTRKTKKFAETSEDETATTGNVITEEEIVPIVKKAKKSKKKKSRGSDINENQTETTETVEQDIKEVSKKSKKKKKKGKQPKTLDEPEVKKTCENNTSNDSFHSAASSPLLDENIVKNTKKMNTTFDGISQNDKSHNDTNEKSTRKNRKSIVDTASPGKCEVDSGNVENLLLKDVSGVQNDTIEKEPRKRRKSSIKVQENNVTPLKEFKSPGTSNIDSEIAEQADPDQEYVTVNDTFEKQTKKRRKSSIKVLETDVTPLKELQSPEKCEVDSTTVENTQPDNVSGTLNNTFETDPKQQCKSSIKVEVNDVAPLKELNSPEKCEFDSKLIENACFVNVSGTLNNTFEKEPKGRRKSSIKVQVNDTTVTSLELNTTFDKVEIKETTDKLNTTFEKEPKVRRSLRSSHSLAENCNNSTAKPLNSTYDKDSSKEENQIINLDTTFDKSNPLNSTFDKNEKVDSGKSSLISSDASTNLTFDKDNSSRISITSDESKTENIVNTTPVLIESSIDDSRLSSTRTSDINETKENEISPRTSDIFVTKETEISPKPVSKEITLVPTTPIRREGTFTKEISEFPLQNRTPTRKTSLASPGFTPFPTTRSSQKTVLNVTRSIEKSRRSSVAEAVPRQTRVMFCSPVNNPAAVAQQKRKVIKSSIKGSNKSFVFEDKEAAVRPAARKRSLTQNDAEEHSSKRKRLAEGLQHSVNRLSRPRTSSAAAKLTHTPSKKAPTPSKPKSDIKRTKLPNFAALHQKEFDKMESLDECVDRKAKRARQLLTPNGGVNVLERNSKTPEQEKEDVKDKKPKEAAKTPEKLATPVKFSNLPTLDSLRPGYTRFGFKMNCGVNPFSFTSKTTEKKPQKSEKPNILNKSATFAPETTEKKPQKTEKLNRLNKSAIFAPKNPIVPTSQKPLTRQPTLPSLNGTTISRKEVAKQTVLREKSFTSLSGKRDKKRNENRTIIKGVRTNRRFDLQMKMRNID